MKAKHFKKIRSNLADKQFLKLEIEHLERQLNNWRTFQQFECSSFFRGYELAKRNQKRYTQGHKKTIARLKYIDKHYEKKI
tara:strand:- start:931 stop:1173 length:243 start_codon:yes stop_codon:yes gene_type:complete